MFCVAATLHDKGARFGGIEIYKGHGRTRIRQAGNQCTHIFRKTGAFENGIKITQARVDQAAVAATVGHGQVAHH